MKNTMMLMTFLIPLLSQAGGYRCEGQCVAIDTYAAHVQVLGQSVAELAGTTQGEVFDYALALCRQTAGSYGVPRYVPVNLVRRISFQQDQVHQYNLTSRTYRATQGVRVLSNSYSGMEVIFRDVSWRTDQYSQVTDWRSLQVDAEFSSAQWDCQYDPQITNTQKVYTGSIEIWD